jgi:hypothetical protein
MFAQLLLALRPIQECDDFAPAQPQSRRTVYHKNVSLSHGACNVANVTVIIYIPNYLSNSE